MIFPDLKYSPIKVLSLQNANQKAVGLELFWILLFLVTIHSNAENSTIEFSVALGPADISAALSWWTERRKL